jgi:hypothetical protein
VVAADRTQAAAQGQLHGHRRIAAGQQVHGTLGVGVQHTAGLGRIALVHGQRQRADGAAKATAFAQHDHVLCQGWRLGAASSKASGRVWPVVACR